MPLQEDLVSRQAQYQDSSIRVDSKVLNLKMIFFNTYLRAQQAKFFQIFRRISMKNLYFGFWMSTGGGDDYRPISPTPLKNGYNLSYWF